MSLKSLLQNAGLVQSEFPATSSAPKPIGIPLVPAPASSNAKIGTAAPVSADPATLSKLTAEVNTAAPPKYLQFLAVMERMAQKPAITTAAKYQAAAAAVDITIAEIDAAVDGLLERLAREESEYEGVVAQSTQSQVNGRRDEIARLEKENLADRDRISKLEAAIRERQTAVEANQSEIARNTADIQAAAVTFKITAAALRGQLEAGRAEAHQHLAQ